MNDRVRDLCREILSDNWYTLNKYTFEYRSEGGDWQRQEREAYDRGNGATILLYNPRARRVVLTRQFRLPTFVNGNPDGMLIEACAGLLDERSPEECIRRETEEETGYQVQVPRKVFQAYMSPGSVTEVLHFFVAEYSAATRVGEGGGLAEEQEHIEVLELNIDEAYAMIESGDICDGKTIMLLQYAKLNRFFDSI